MRVADNVDDSVALWDRLGDPGSTGVRNIPFAAHKVFSVLVSQPETSETLRVHFHCDFPDDLRRIDADGLDFPPAAIC